MERCRKRLEQFLIDLLEPVGRSERRHWGAVYVRGLLLDGERKSVEPMAKRLPDGNEQALQQFVGQSPWEWVPVWERLSRRMVRELEPEALWVVDDTGFPKQGEHSVGVARQYSGTLGKTANCQVAVSLHEVCSEGAAGEGATLAGPSGPHRHRSMAVSGAQPLARSHRRARAAIWLTAGSPMRAGKSEADLVWEREYSPLSARPNKPDKDFC